MENYKITMMSRDSEQSKEIAEIIRTTLEAELSNFKEHTVKAPIPEYLTREKTCSMLKISYSTLHRMVNSAVLPCYKLGRKSMFKIEDVKCTLIKINK